MSGKIWIYADPHFYQPSMCRFTDANGVKIRPWDDYEQMSEDMITWYNALVHPEDRVYILGDVAMNRKALDRSLPRLVGRKILVKGNHDDDKLSYYSQYFDDIRAYVQKKGFLLSHIPIHPESLSRWGVNIHGHLHTNMVKLEGKPDPRYFCASVEHTNFRPILLDTILKKVGIR